MMAREVSSEGGTPRPAAKRQRMGPQECLEYSNTSSGAAPLTNPSSVPRSRPDEHKNLVPSQRGKTQGSCFISSNQPGYNGGHGSKQARQYVSPSKGIPKPSGSGAGGVYNHSGYACIGSPYKKKFNRRQGHPRSSSYPQAKNRKFSKVESCHGSIPQMNESWKHRTDSSSKREECTADRPSASTGQFHPQTQFCGMKTEVWSDQSFAAKSTHSWKQRANSGDIVTSSSSKCSDPWSTSPQQKRQPQRSSITQSLGSSQFSQFSRRDSSQTVTSNSPQTLPVEGGSIRSSAQRSQFVKHKGCATTANPQRNSARKDVGVSENSPLARHVHGQTVVYQEAKLGNSSQSKRTSEAKLQKKSAITSKSNPVSSQALGQKVKRSLSVKPRKSSTSSSSTRRVRATPKNPLYPKLSPTKSSPNKSPGKQSQLTSYFKVTPKKQETSSVEGKPSVKRDLNQVWISSGPDGRHQKDHQDNENTLPKNAAKTSNNDSHYDSKNGSLALNTPPATAVHNVHNGSKSVGSPFGKVTTVKTEPMSSQDSVRSCDLSSLSVSSQPDSVVGSQPDPIAESLEAFENDSVEDLLEDYDMKEDGSFVASQSSLPSQGDSDKNGDMDSSVAESLEAFENDSVEDLFEDYDLMGDGSFVASQSSLPSQGESDENGVKDSSVGESLEAFENDSVEDLLEDYDLMEDGSLVASQPSQPSQEESDKNGDMDSSVAGSLEAPDNDSDSEEVDPIEIVVVDVSKREGRMEEMAAKAKEDNCKDDETGSTSSEESVPVFLMRRDEDGNASGADNDADTDLEGTLPISIAGGTDVDRKKASSSSQQFRKRRPRQQELVTLSNPQPLALSRLNPSESSEMKYEHMIDDEEIPEELFEQLDAGRLIDQVTLKGRTFGLVGNDGDVEEEEGDYFEPLPVEVLENIFCRIPILDLSHSCVRVCQRWRDIISNQTFIPWKKAYTQCKRGDGQWVSPLAESSQESCLLDLIKYLSTINRVPGVSTTKDLERHPKYSFAKDMIAENLPDLVQDGTPHPWSVIAALAILAESVADVKDIMACLLHHRASNSHIAVTEILYCIATLLLSLQRQHNLNRRLHYRVFYALFLHENAMMSPPVLTGNTSEKPENRVGQRSSFPLTHEQKRIVNHKLDMNNMNEVVKVVAFAGTGKTTTLIKFAEANIYLHLLYVAFNKSVQVEASRRFPGNTECRTSHSLAWEVFKRQYDKKLTFGDLRPYDIKTLLPERGKSEKSSLHYILYARLVAETLKAYMASADDIITTRHVPVDYVTATAPRTMLSHEDKMKLLRDAEHVWGRMVDERDREARITHDGYLKLYQLSKPIIPGVQCLLIDEAQDLTPAQQDILLRQPVPKILVGDPNQQIYSFRGARNAMDAIQANTVYHLTQSFRFGSEIAYMASCILDVFKDMTEQTVVGKDEDGSLRGEPVGQVAIICRGNTTIFKEAVRLVTTTPPGTPLRLGFTAVGGFDFNKLMDLYKMSCGASLSSIDNRFYRKFESFINLEAYASNAQDNELLGLIKIVRIYNHQIPEFVSKIKAKTVKKLDYATIILTTAHKSKGLEFDTVRLTEDFLMFGPRIVRKGEELLITEDITISEDEKNLIYVACTRAKRSLLLNVGLKTCLQKASDQLKFPLSTKLFLEQGATLEERRCLDCGQPITSQHRITMVKVWSVKLASSRGTQQQNNSANKGGYICSLCAHHHMRGFEKIFLGERNAPTAASIETNLPVI